MVKIRKILKVTNIHWLQLLSSFNYSPKRFAKKHFFATAFRQWRKKVLSSPNHSAIYGMCTALKCQEYLSLPPFRGRSLLTKLRVNDLKLAGAGYKSAHPEHCGLCKLEFETREHFLVSCPCLQEVRVRHHPNLPVLLEVLDKPPVVIAQQILLVFKVSNLPSYAPLIGNLIADLWYERWIQLCEIDPDTPYSPHYP